MNNLISSIGIMEGRLLPKYKGRYQAHPVGYWKEEFPVAAKLGFDYVEFILDYNESDQNPLMFERGLQEIKDITDTTKVGVRSVCADYFMEAPLHHADQNISINSASTLRILMHNCAALEIKDIVIPCVDQSSLLDSEACARFVEVLTPFQELAEKLDVNLSLETDLAPEPFKQLLDNFGSKKVTVNYDTGNSASLGYDPIEEFAVYGGRISDIHIKDRKLGGGSVILGTGDVKFDRFFKALSTIDYSGPFVMQVFRDEEGVDICMKQLDWFKNNFLSL